MFRHEHFCWCRPRSDLNDFPTHFLLVISGDRLSSDFRERVDQDVSALRVT